MTKDELIRALIHSDCPLSGEVFVETPDGDDDFFVDKIRTVDGILIIETSQ